MIGHLRPEEFREFFVAVHGVAPFPWQEGLARKVFAGHWPALDIPTGAGKTAVIDIAIFHLALEATLGLERRAPIRILFVVDRRLVVDDAYNRAQTVARKLSDRKLSETKDGILKRVADRLRYLAENEDAPLRVARLRGGMPKEPDWARTPAQPLVVVSTVDQVGSRFLFRGYGISDTMKPIHAGLVGADALLFLDEAHLSQPFAQTARDSTMFRTEPWVRSSAGAPFRIVTLSATPVPGEAEEVPLRIGDADRADSRLAPRLNVSKPAELVDPTSADDEVAAFADKAGEFAGGPGSGRVVAIVVNRVKRARAIFEALLTRGVRPLGEQSRDGESSSVAEAALLIGRARDLDRDRLLSDLLPFVHAGTARKPRTAPLFIVATQCIRGGRRSRL
ncbi:MAG: type I-U CRISPR-associated helicase/endonuclease Cas3 [Candidatus Binataceae bacterium]